jgi:hypothetical protein
MTKNGSTVVRSLLAGWENPWEPSSFAIASGTNSILVVSLLMHSGETVSGIKWGGSGGTALSKVTSVTSGQGWTNEIWYLVAPTVQTSTLYFSFSGGVGEIAMAATVWDGALQTNPFHNADTASSDWGNPATIDIVSAVGELVIDCAGFNGLGMLSSWGQTKDADFTLTYKSGATSHAAGAASVTMSYTLTGDAAWAICGASLQPAAGGGTPINIALAVGGS